MSVLYVKLLRHAVEDFELLRVARMTSDESCVLFSLESRSAISLFLKGSSLRATMYPLSSLVQSNDEGTLALALHSMLADAPELGQECASHVQCDADANDMGVRLHREIHMHVLPSEEIVAPEAVAWARAELVDGLQQLADWASDVRWDYVTSEWLPERLPGFHATGLGGAAPFQAEGEWHGYHCHFRYHLGRATLRVSMPRNPSDPESILWSSSSPWGDGTVSSWLAPDNFALAFHHLASTLQPHPFPYRFPLLNTDPAAHTPESESPRIVGHGWSVESARRNAQEWLRACPTPNFPTNAQVGLTPDSFDERVFPEVYPLIVLPR